MTLEDTGHLFSVADYLSIVYQEPGAHQVRLAGYKPVPMGPSVVTPCTLEL